MIELGTMIMGEMVTSLVHGFFHVVKEGNEESVKRYAAKCAQNKIKTEPLKQYLEQLEKTYSKELEDAQGYTEEELRAIFDESYDENLQYTAPEVREELWEAFLTYASIVIKKYNKSISFGEKRILEKARETETELRLNRKILQELSKKQAELQKKLVQDTKIPFVDFNKLYGAEICKYEPQYMLYGNAFDCNNRTDFGCNERVYVLRFLLKNVGQANIEKISIENFKIKYVVDFEEDRKELSFSLLPMTEYDEKIQHNINILPQGEEFLQLVLERLDEELATDEELKLCSGKFNSDILYVTFDMGLKGDVEKTYCYTLLLSKKNGDEDDDIKGQYRIDYAGFVEA